MFLTIKFFRTVNKIKQRDLAEFLGVSKVYLSLVENEKSKLSDEKIDILYSYALEQNWDIESLNPAFYRLYQVAQLYNAEETAFDINTCESILPVQRKEVLDIKHGKVGISDEVAEKIAQSLPDLSIEWLKTGVGSTFKIETEVYSESENADDMTKLISRLDHILNHLNDMERRQILIDEKLNKLLKEKCK